MFPSTRRAPYCFACRVSAGAAIEDMYNLNIHVKVDRIVTAGDLSLI
jgi:hypothetical protein